jgi:hypothetical protein
MFNVYNKIQGRINNQFYGGIAMKILLILLITILAAGLFSGQSQAGETMMGKEASGMMESTA